MNNNYLIDTHCHLHDPEFFDENQAEELLKQARDEYNVQQLICIGTNPADSETAAAFAAAHEGVFWTYGVHPEYADYYSSEFPDFTKYAKPPVAIGEIGLDYGYETYDRMTEIGLFEEMLQLARDNNLPISLHIRNAFDDALAVLDNFPGLTGVIHSFTGSKKVLKQALARDFFIGVNGLATYSTLPLPPLEKVVLETDAPFLTPIPKRGTMNVPGYVRYVARYLSEKMGVAEELIVEQTTKNAKGLFRL